MEEQKKVSAQMKKAIDKIKASIKTLDCYNNYEFKIEYLPDNEDGKFYNSATVTCRTDGEFGIYRRLTVTRSGLII